MPDVGIRLMAVHVNAALATYLRGMVGRSRQGAEHLDRVADGEQPRVDIASPLV